VKKLILAIPLVGLLIAGAASAEAKTYNDFANTPCSDFTEFYAKSGLRWEGIYPSWRNDQFGLRLGYIWGYLTYASKHVVAEGEFIKRFKSPRNIIAWIGSWCRNHPDDNLSDAMDALIDKLDIDLN
jgi:hypothetical protein